MIFKGLLLHRLHIASFWGDPTGTIIAAHAYKGKQLYPSFDFFDSKWRVDNSWPSGMMCLSYR